MIQTIGRLNHHPLEGTLFVGCRITKLGLAAFEVELPEPNLLLIAQTPWPTHTVTVIDKGPTTKHIVSYGPDERPHVSPACPFKAFIYKP